MFLFSSPEGDPSWNTGDETRTLIDGAFQVDVCCPRCQGRRIHRHGMARGLQRYKCLDCARTFNAQTGTPMAGLRKRGLWLTYAASLNASETVRTAAAHAGIAPSTSFRWQHCFLNVRKDDKYQ